MNIPLALEHGWPGTQWKLNGNDYAGLIWLDVSPKPTLAEINTTWLDFVSKREDIEAEKDIDKDRIMRLIFEINFDQENRLRALEGMPIITKTQYKNALIVKYKTL